MLNDRSTALRTRSLLWLFLLLVPFVAGACITVQSDVEVTPTPAVAQASPSTSPTVAPLASPTPDPTPEPTPEPVEATVLGFVPHWQFESAAAAIDPELVTIAAFHSMEAAANGRLVKKKANGDVPGGWQMLRSGEFEVLQDELQSAGVKVVPVVQRTAWTEGTKERMIELLSKRRNRLALVEEITVFVEERGFDGVNLDFEPMPAKVAEQFELFVREIRAALDEIDPELHLSIDVVPGLENYDLATLTADDAADLAVIMGYGYRTTSSGTAGSTAPLADPATGDLTESVEVAVAQADGDRLILALPWYGIDWPTESAQARATTRKGDGFAPASSLDYADARAQAAKTGRRYQPDQASAWTTYAAKGCADCTPSWRQAWYDDPDSFGVKVDSALEAGLAGIGVWALGMDGGEEDMWLSLRHRLTQGVDEVPPGGSPSLDPDSVQGDIDGRSIITGSASLRLFASDDPEGSGLAFVRVGQDDELDRSGKLESGRTYPAVERVEFPLGDEATGGSETEGPRSIYVQWRDIAGNWSVPVVIEAHVLSPDATTTPADL